MAAITGAVITAGAAAYSANRQANAADDAANAAQNASDASIAEQRRQYDQSRQDQMPWMQAGQDALGRQQAFLDGDMSGFENSAMYRFARDQMAQGSERSAAARGGLNSGRFQVDLASQMNGLAGQHANTYWNQLAGRAGQGQATASGLGALGANMAGNVGNDMWGAANARASGYQQRADANSQLGFGLAGIFNNLQQNNWGKTGTKPIGSSNPYKG
jgi:hypothetical protein